MLSESREMDKTWAIEGVSHPIPGVRELDRREGVVMCWRVRCVCAGTKVSVCMCRCWALRERVRVRSGGERRGGADLKPKLKQGSAGVGVWVVEDRG